MRFALLLFALVLLLISPMAVSSQKNTALQQTPKIKIAFQETTLKNGLRVITVEDHHAPVISLALIYNVGGANEGKGLGGFAHLFEHLMFQGTQNIEPGEFNNLIANNGGYENAMTGGDRTAYFETVPSNQLELPLFLEADRLRGLSITQERLDKERNVVQEEYRLRVLNQPYGRSRQVLTEMLYDNFAYKHGGMDSTADLNSASLADIKEFFKTYYAPNNVVLVLVGDFETDDALVKIKKYFEDIPRQPAPPALDLTEPEQKTERRRVIEDGLAQVPQIALAFKAVPGNTPDSYALEILSAVLQDGRSSRLYQKLVAEKQLVSNVGGEMSEKRGLGAFYITATLRPEKKTDEVEAAIYQEIERLQKEQISEAELEKAKNMLAFSFNSSLNRSLTRGITLGQLAVLYNDPNLINVQLDKFAAVTREDVQRVAQKYLKPTNRVVVITVPKTDKTKDEQGEKK